MKVVQGSPARAVPGLAGTSIRWWWLAFALLAAGCGPKLVTTVAPGENQIEVSSIAVYAFQLRGRTEPALSYQKTVDLVSAALAPRRFLIYSFNDFQLFNLDSLDAYEGRSLLATARDEGLDLNRLAILKGEALFVTDDPGQAPAQSGHRAADRSQVKASVELYHYGLHQTLARAETTFVVDPLDATQVDPYPALTRQARRLADQVMAMVLKRVKAPPPHAPLPITFYADHDLLFKIASDDTPSLARQMLSMDEVGKAAELLRGYQYFYPDISLLQLQRLDQTPGLLVTGVSESWLQAQGLEPGDLITRVNGRRVESAHQLDRQVARVVSHEPLKMTIVRRDKEVELELKQP
jgi:hypothetical protein